LGSPAAAFGRHPQRTQGRCRAKPVPRWDRSGKERRRSASPGGTGSVRRWAGRGGAEGGGCAPLPSPRSGDVPGGCHCCCRCRGGAGWGGEPARSSPCVALPSRAHPVGRRAVSPHYHLSQAAARPPCPPRPPRARHPRPRRSLRPRAAPRCPPRVSARAHCRAAVADEEAPVTPTWDPAGRGSRAGSRRDAVCVRVCVCVCVCACVCVYARASTPAETRLLGGRAAGAAVLFGQSEDHAWKTHWASAVPWGCRRGKEGN
jgi:hypothetical protein